VTVDPLPFTGFGIGLRAPHYADVLERHADLDFVEFISENFMIDGGRPLWVLDQIRERLPVALHGVSMSIGSADGVDPDYLRRLRRLVDRVQPLFVSDHLCWTGVDGINTHDLLPLPYTTEALGAVVANVRTAQDVLGRALLIENPSTYVSFLHDEMTEPAFLAALCDATGCGLLLDVNNVHVSAVNHGFDAEAYLRALPRDQVRQIHLAGHSAGETMLVDTHDTDVCEDVWSLYDLALSIFGKTATMIERDDDIPAFGALMREINIARGRAAAMLADAA
jgi:uncharacterized protein (UPF0276 family)